jgi:hypothetical protein
MRWVLPLLLVVALAVCVADPSRARRARRPRLPRAALAGPSWAPREAIAPDITGDAAAMQRAMFDASTGTLTWFDDEAYN